jgi:uncharacterized protein DUF6152
MMITRLCGSLAALLLGSMLTVPAMAHHSFAMFDLTKEEKVSGTIKTFEFTNPHTITRLTTRTPDGRTQDYTFEGVSTGVLFKAGWRPNTLRPGDKVTIFYAPLRNGAHGGMFLRATLPDGHTIYNVGILKGSPAYKPENEAEQRKTIEALKAERAKEEAKK